MHGVFNCAAQQAGGILNAIDRSLGQQLRHAGLHVYQSRFFLFLHHRRGVGHQIVNQGHKGRASSAVNQSVMHLGVNGETALGQVGDIVQTLDNVGLPQGARHIQWTRVQPGDLDAQLAPVPRLGQGDVPQVELHVEIGVFYPVGAIQATGYFNQTGAEQGLLGQAALKPGDYVLEADKTAGSRRGVINAQSTHVLGGVGLLEIDKCRVENA